MNKQAQGVPNLQFEGSFADLAYTYLKDKAPALLDHIVGFQVIHKNDDETRAAGQFGFLVGDQWMFVPCFFMNGELKGHEVLYLKDQDLFVPLQENWVNYVISKRAQVLGEPSPLEEKDTGIGHPDMGQYARSPLSAGMGKQSSTDLTGYFVDGEAFDVFPGIAPAAVPPDNERSKEAAQRLDLPTFLSQNKEAAELFVRTMAKSAEFSEAVLSFYDVDDFVSKTFSTKEAACSDTASIVGEPEGKVEIIVGGSPSDDYSALDDDEKRTMISDGFVARDSRKDTNELYRKDTGDSFVSPAANDRGIFDLFLSNHEMHPVFICGTPLTIGSGKTESSIAVSLSGRGWCLRKPSEFFISQPALTEKQSFEDYFDSLAAISTIKKSKENDYFSGPAYMIVTRNGKATLPFRVMAQRTVNGVKEIYTDYPGYIPGVSHAYDRVETPASGNDFAMSSRRIVVVDGDECRMKNTGDTLVVTSACKVIKVDAADDDKIKPGTLTDIDSVAYRSVKTAGVRIYGGHGSYQVSVNGKLTSPMRKKACVEYLTMQQRLPAAQVVQALSEAESRGHADYVIKYAQGVVPPAIPDPGTYYDGEMRNQVQPSVDAQMGVGMPADPAMGSPDPTELMNPNAINTIIEAAESGDKEIFDTAAVSNLVETMNAPDLIDQYLSDLVIGMDRIGRILFLFYWHNSAFESRYGQEELQELEDTLRDTFRGIGNLVLFMKKKTAEPSILLRGTDVDLTTV